MPACAQPGDDRRVVRRDPARRILRRTWSAGRPWWRYVLDRDRHPGQERQRLPRGALLVDRLGLGERALGVDVQVRVHGRVDGRGPVQVRLRHLDGADLLAAQRLGQLGGSPAGQVIGHVRVPWCAGTFEVRWLIPG